MENPLYFIYGSTIKENLTRLLIVLLSLFNISIFFLDFLQYLSFISGLLALTMILMIIFFFPRITYVSMVQITNGLVLTNRWYANKIVQKTIGKKNFNQSFQLLKLDRIEIQYLGLISKIGRIVFIFTDKTRLKILFSPLQISSDHVKKMKGFFENFKFIESETINNLVVLLEYFSYDFDIAEFHQFENKNILYFVIITFLLLVPIWFLLHIY